MQLANFILDHIEPILAEFETFARSIWPGAATDPATLRDHAEAVLRATVADMGCAQTETERADKSHGTGHGGRGSDRMNRASVQHGEDRSIHAFDLAAVISEYRALRASVLRLWRESTPVADASDLDDLTRFNESIDQSLTAAVKGYSDAARQTADALVASQAARLGAETANRAKDEFLRTLSHELRTPLNSVVLWLYMLQRKPCTPEQVREGLASIERNTQAQLHMIEDILDVSAIVSGKLGIAMRVCPLDAPVRAAVAALEKVAREKGVLLSATVEAAVPRVRCDPKRVEQVVWNLLSNAIKFTPAGGAVSVTLDRVGPRDRPQARIRVDDAGRGIDADFLPHVFDRFQQADGSTTRTAGGLGLGLAIVKHLVEAHGGTIDADSAGAGKGATFTVHLPAVDA